MVNITCILNDIVIIILLLFVIDVLIKGPKAFYGDNRETSKKVNEITNHKHTPN